MKAWSIAMSFGVLIGITLIAGCASPPVKPVETRREPASACEVTPKDEAFAAKILAHPERYDRKITSHLRALVEGYLLGEELKEEFDRKLDKTTDPEKLYSSDTYAKLLALKSIMFQTRSRLEGIYVVRINSELRSESNRTREQLIDENLAAVRLRMEDLIRSGKETAHARMALLSIESDLEVLRDYYVTCDPAVMERFAENNFEARLKRHEAALKDIETAPPLEKGASEAWGPTSDDENGIAVGRFVRKSFLKLRVQLKAAFTRGRSPSSVSKIFPDVGPKGNITGNQFPANVWALTYDDGPGPLTPKVLANLAKHNLKANFFILASNVTPKGYPELARKERTAGHSVLSHSYSHPQMQKLGPQGRHKEIVVATKMIEDVIGERPGFFRLPYGAGVNNAAVRQTLKDAGLIHVFWNVDTLDWQDKNPDSIYQRALKQMNARGRGVILFHDVHSQSVVASEMVMRYLADPANHIQTVTLPEIVDRINKGQ